MTLKMVKKPTYAGSVKDKDQADIFHWAFNKSAAERICESWRLHCMNHNISPDQKLNKSISKAVKKCVIVFLIPILLII